MLALIVLANAQVKIFAKSPTGVLTMKAVQKDLNLSDDQVAGIKKIQDDFRSTVNGNDVGRLLWRKPRGSSSPT